MEAISNDPSGEQAILVSNEGLESSGVWDRCLMGCLMWIKVCRYCEFAAAVHPEWDCSKLLTIRRATESGVCRSSTT